MKILFFSTILFHSCTKKMSFQAHHCIFSVLKIEQLLTFYKSLELKGKIMIFRL